MVAPLLQTKVFIPREGPHLVSRPRLIERLSEQTERKLTLVSAPAGFGKTTVIGEWLAASDKPFAWLSLDSADNDPHRLLSYLALTLQQIDKQIGVGVRTALDSSSPPPLNYLLTELINDIAVTEDAFTLVLDDYHVIESQEVHDAIDYILDHMPPNMHLGITSRIDPPLALARLRVRGQMIELRAADLRFTVDEAASFLNDSMGVELSAEDVAILEKRTEGWIASLQLAALSLQSRTDKHQFVEAFSGSHRHIIDYLVDEVMSAQTDEERDFLLGTSILEQLHAPLCDELLGITNSQQQLDKFDRENMFLVSLDDQRSWFRYHHLFSEFLSQRLSERGPEEVARLHLRAVNWMTANGYVEQAFNHAIAAKEFETAADIIEPVAMDMVWKGQVAALLKWTAVIPDAVIDQRPRLLLSQIWASLWSIDRSGVLPLIERLSKAIPGIDDPKGKAEIEGNLKFIRATIDRDSSDFGAGIEFSKEILDLIPDGGLHFRALVEFGRGYELYVMGRHGEAIASMREAQEVGPKAQPYMVLSAMSWLGKIEEHKGNLAEAAKLYHSVITHAAEIGGISPLPVGGYGHVGTGRIQYEKNDLEEAETSIVRGVMIGEQAHEIGTMMLGYLALVKLRLVQGRFDDAADVMQKTHDLAPEAMLPVEVGQLDSWSALVSLTKGDREAASKWADGALKQSSEYQFMRQASDQNLVRILVGLDRAAEAIPIIERTLEGAETDDRTGDVVAILALMAIAHDKAGQKDEAIATLVRAVKLAEPAGYMRTFIDEGEAMADLLRAVVGVGSLTGYLRKLIDGFGALSRQTAEVSQYMVDPLSDREIEVLGHIAEGLKYQEIADQLIVSLNTVRFHTRNVYSKLQVNSRTDAINKGRELELI